MKMPRFLLLLTPLLAIGCVGPGRHPHAFLPPIAEEYYICEKCGSLHGGIYGKGPLASFETKEAAACWHRWHQVSKAEFQKKAEGAFPAEWSKALPFFKVL
jgi:hypothetical protein